MKNILNNKKIIYIMLAVIIAAQLAYLVYVFAYLREGFHSDESWSYGFANSYYEPYLYMEPGEDINLSDATPINADKWVSGQVLRDYLTVNKNQRFSYGSVYYNMSKDINLPLHEMILHTICSFFPESFSWWYSFSINIVFFVLTQILLFCFVSEFMKSKTAGVLVALYYGFTTGAVNCFTYLRSYAMLTFFTLLLVYLAYRMYIKDFENIRKELIFTILTTLLGGFTHYYFYAFAFFFAACMCIYLLVLKKWKKLFAYAGSMLGSVVLDIIIYPSIVPKLLLGAGGNVSAEIKLPYDWDLATCVSVILYECIGIQWSTVRNIIMFIPFVIFVLLLLAAGTLFVFRNETWMIEWRGRAAAWIKNWKANIQALLKKCNIFGIMLFVSMFATVMVVAQVCDVAGMNVYMNRYLFYMMIIFIILLSAVILYICRKICGKICKKQGLGLLLFTAVLCVFIAINNINGRYTYIFPTSCDEAPLAELTDGADCIIISSSIWKLQWYSSELLNVNSFDIIDNRECLESAEQLGDYAYDANRPVYLIVETSLFLQEGDDVSTYVLTGEHLLLDTTRQLIYETELTDYLVESVDWIDSVTALYERTSFIGNFKVYKIN